MGDIAIILFGLAGLLAIIGFLPPLAARLRLPYSVLLAVLGCLLGAAIAIGPADADLSPFGLAGDFLAALGRIEITADAFLTIFLPLLLFEAALMLNSRALLDDLAPVLLLAVIAVFVTTAVAGLAVWGASGLPLAACLLLASIIATTDPSAVVAIFRELGAPQRLSHLVEGESLFNDAAAIALFGVLLAITAGPVQPDIATIALRFLWDFAGGLLLGYGAGRLGAALLGRLGDDRIAEITFTVALAYLTFLVGEHHVLVSGVVAVATAGLVLGHFARLRLPKPDWQAITLIWSQLAFWASSLVFVLASMLVPRFLHGTTTADLLLLPVLVGGALLARLLVLWGLLPLLTGLGLAARVDDAYRVVILWGGLRGAVTLALALAVGENPAVPPTITHAVGVLATGFVLFTLFVQATTLRPLIRGLRLDRLSPIDQVTRRRVMALALHDIHTRLADAALAYRIDPDTAEEVAAGYRRRLDTLGDAPEIACGPLEVELAIGLTTLADREAELYREHLDAGLMPPRIAAALTDQAQGLIDGLKQGGPEGYVAAGERQLEFGTGLRLALWLHRRLRLERPLARGLALHFDQLVVRAKVLRDLERFVVDKLAPLLGPAAATQLGDIVGARAEANQRAQAALQLQFPDYGRALGRRYLGRAALRLEERAYRRLFEDYLIGPEVLRDLIAELHEHRRRLRRAPRLDLGLAVPDLVRRVPLFRDLPADRIAAITRLLRPQLALPGEQLIAKGARGDRMYIIVSGAVEVALPGAPVRLGSGDFFGEIALITRRPRTADVHALGYCQLLSLDGRAFRRFLRGHPALKAEIQEVARSRLRSRIRHEPIVVSRET